MPQTQPQNPQQHHSNGKNHFCSLVKVENQSDDTNDIFHFQTFSDQQPPQHWMQYPLTSRNPYNDELHLQDQYQVSDVCFQTGEHT